MTRTGTIKMNGSVIGYIEEVITIDNQLMEAKLDQGDIVPFTDDGFDDVSFGDSSSGRAEGTDTGKSFHHHGIGHSRPSHAPHKNRHHFPGHVHHPAPGRHHFPGHAKDRQDADPDFKYNATGAGHPFDRARFAKELEQKPWLKEKIKHISLGENQDPTANTAVIETMMNRAAVRGTSLEQQAKRHRSSGVDEGGYYAGYAAGYSADKGAMADRNIAAALRGSNVTNYATDNSSGNLAAREIASGAFRHHKTINGESFFSPGSAEPAFRDRWQSMNKKAKEHEQAKQSAMPTQTAPMFASSKGKGYGEQFKGTPNWGWHQGTWKDLNKVPNIVDRRSNDQSMKGVSKHDMLVNKFIGDYDTLKRADAIKESPSQMSTDLGINSLLKGNEKYPQTVAGFKEKFGRDPMTDAELEFYNK